MNDTVSEAGLVEAIADELVAHGEFSSIPGQNHANASRAARAILPIIRAYLASTKPPEEEVEHETCALCGQPAPEGYVEHDYDGEAMHPHCRAAASASTKPPLADVTVEEIERIVLETEPDVPASVDGSKIWTRRMAKALHARLYASPPMPGRGEGFVLVPVELTDEMILARWPSYHPWGQNAPPPEDRPGMYAEMVEKTKALWAVLLASRPKEDTQQ